MKKIYFYDKQTKKFAGMDIIADDAEMPENATKVEVDSSLLGPYWDGQAWKGLSQEEFNKQNPATPPEDWQPSQDDQQDAQTMLLIANLTQQIQEQQKLNAQMMLQIADLTQKVQQ